MLFLFSSLSHLFRPNFVFLDTKPKLKTHYRAHRLSFWLNLVPDLHNSGNDDVPYSHHQLVDDASDRPPVGPTVKPLNPPAGKDPGRNSNYSLFTTQMFSLLNLSSQNNKSKSRTPDFGDDHETNELHGSNNAGNSNDDGFAAYSTALSVTIAIGCSLLILNVLIFAGVYYQRDKTRLNEPRNGGGQTQMGHGTLNSVLKKRNENGQMPNNICGELETLTIHTKSDPATILNHSSGHYAMQHHQLPPPEFADIPQRAPPPPKHVKTLTIMDGGMSVAAANQMLPAHALQLIGANCTGTLQKKSCVKNSNSAANSQQQQMQLQHQHHQQQQQQHQHQHQQHQQQQQQHQQQHHQQQQQQQQQCSQNQMDELRV